MNLRIKYISMPYNFNSAEIFQGDWTDVRRLRTDPDKTIIWVKEGSPIEGVHYGQVMDGSLKETVVDIVYDKGRGWKFHKSPEYIKNVEEEMKKSVVLL
jgi:hypothetical protein